MRLARENVCPVHRRWDPGWKSNNKQQTTNNNINNNKHKRSDSIFSGGGRGTRDRKFRCKRARGSRHRKTNS